MSRGQWMTTHWNLLVGGLTNTGAGWICLSVGGENQVSDLAQEVWCGPAGGFGFGPAVASRPITRRAFSAAQLQKHGLPRATG